MGNIVGEEIPGYTSGQINKRQEIHGKTSGRTPQELTVLNSNTSWVKLASGVSVDKDKLKELELNEDLSGMALARENILFGGTSSKPKGTSKKGGIPSPKKYPKSPVAGYEHTEDFGIVPMPGIESISIKNLNRGSIKKAKIKIKVYSRSQFEIIDTLYLRLGYTALLEWGNANYISNDTENEQGEFKTVKNTLVEDPTRFFNIDFEKDRSWRDILPVIDKYRARYQGNYDGFLGKISNFSWDFNPDGSYDIDLEMISMGDVIESLKSNVSISTKLSDFIKTAQLNISQNASGEGEPDPLAPYNNNNLITSMLWVWKYLGKDDTKSTSKGLSIKTGDEKVGFIGRILKNPSNSTIIDTFKLTAIAIFRRTGNFQGEFFEEGDIEPFDDVEPRIVVGNRADAEKARKFMIREEFRGNIAFRILQQDVIIEKSSRVQVYDFLTTSYIPTKSIIRLNTEKQDHYIKFEYLLQYLKEKVIPRIKINSGATGNNDKFTPLFELDFNTGDGGKTDVLTGNYMYTLPNQISLDPRVCVVRNDSVYKVGTPNVPARVFPQLPPFRLVDEKSTTKHPNHAYLLNMYLNFDFVVSSLDSNTDDRGDVGLFGFIDALCKGINKAMGGINNLEPVMDESSNKLKIIDSSLSRGKKRGAYGLEIVGYNPNFNSSTFLRNINLKTAITPEYATMMTIGSTAGGYVKGVEATAFSNWNKGLTDRFKTEVVLAQNTQVSGSVDVSDGNEAEKNYIENYLRKYVACYGFQGRGKTPNPFNDWTRTGKRAEIKFVGDIISSNISIVTEYYKFLQNKNKKGNTIGFIPFKFSFDMDGLSGFKIYNQLHVSTRFLPRNYGNTLDFIVTGVTNNVKSNDWTTSIETMVVPVTRDTTGIEENITELSEGVLDSAIPTSSVGRGFQYGEFFGGGLTITPAGGTGDTSLGISGPSTPDDKLVRRALTKPQIDSIIQNSNTRTPGNRNNSVIRSRIVEIAASYVGLDELPGNNLGWYNKDYESKFKLLKSPWYQSAPWCVWFCQLVWKEAYTIGNAYVPSVDNITYGDFYKEIWKELKDGKSIRAHTTNVSGADNVPKDFASRFQGTDGRTHSKWVPIEAVKAGKYFPKPGDIVIYTYGHADILVATSGDPTTSRSSFSSIGGNTSASGRTVEELRNGGNTAYQINKSYSSVLGFAVVITPSNVNKDAPSFR